MARETNLPRRNHNTYKDIVDTVVQSSALYSVALLILAITWTITPASTLSGSLHQMPFSYLTKFIEEICFIVAVRRILSLGSVCPLT